jgi:pimeloyl-ACP methyl ester carboxylesterase
VQIVWAHGWGQNSAAFEALAQSFAPIATNYLPDFPGFGATPPPPETWGTPEYALETAAWLKTLPAAPRIWVGHSFGCRVGMHLAAHYPYLFDKMVLIAAAGLKRKRTMFQRINHNAKVLTFKTLKHLTPEGPKRDALRARFGSADYRAAGVLRDSFVRIVNENQASDAQRIDKPTLIVVGANDADTPPEMSKRLNAMIKNSRLEILDGFDHFSIIAEGRHQVASLIKGFISS